MEAEIRLKGITWNHSRGFVPMVATAQRFEELNPTVSIQWEKRSLQSFADGDLSILAEHYDLLVIDHPWAGFAAQSGILEALDGHLEPEFINDQRRNSVGDSYSSYCSNGHLWALAIDAATPVSCYRPDLIKQRDLPLPKTWTELLAWAKAGRVIMPGIPIDTLMNFYMVCVTRNGHLFKTDDQVVDEETGVATLQQMRELASFMPKVVFDWNPIRVYEALVAQDQWLYCPFAYGYSNYSRAGFSSTPLAFGGLVELEGFGRLRSTLGGTGLALSAKSPHKTVAAQYMQMVAGPNAQKTLFFETGGQPGHRTAWVDEESNRRTLNYFKNTLPTLDESYMRPRYAGYLCFQDHAGDPIRNYLMNGGKEITVLQQLDHLYRESKNKIAT